jgi:hypothetical protein
MFIIGAVIKQGRILYPSAFQCEIVKRSYRAGPVKQAGCGSVAEPPFAKKTQARRQNGNYYSTKTRLCATKNQRMLSDRAARLQSRKPWVESKKQKEFPMPRARLDKHDKIHHELFDEDTAQVGSLGSIVDRHDGDAVFLGDLEKSPGGADGGESDFEDEMNESDPAESESMDPDDLYSAADEDSIIGTDQTGTVEGIARGFGTHLPQDIGKDGFQVEEIPNKALKYQSRAVAEGEELDDYDDDSSDGKYDAGPSLSRASEPGMNRVKSTGDHEPTPDRIPVKQPRPRTTDEELDATRRMK